MQVLFAVIVEAAAGLAAELARADHLLQQESGTVLGITGLTDFNRGIHEE